jgi:hypothetical protein
MELLRRAFDGIPAVGVGLDAVADRATEQPVHGLVERFADDVPHAISMVLIADMAISPARA